MERGEVRVQGGTHDLMGVRCRMWKGIHCTRSNLSPGIYSLLVPNMDLYRRLNKRYNRIDLLHIEHLIELIQL